MRWNCGSARHGRRRTYLTLYDGSRLSKDPGERRNQVRAMLQESASIEFKDYFEFLIGQASENLDGAPEGGSRYPVEARMDGREFVRFHVDVGSVMKCLSLWMWSRGAIGCGLRVSRPPLRSGHLARTAVRGETARVFLAARSV
jgi:hypothetical protein